MREREDRHARRVGRPVELGPERLARRVDDAPAPAPGQRPVDRQTVLVGAHDGRVAVERDRPSGDLVAPRAEPGGPRMQERDAERLAAREVVLDPAAEPEQLRAAMAQRAADHPGARREPRLEVAGGESDGVGHEGNVTFRGRGGPLRMECRELVELLTEYL